MVLDGVVVGLEPRTLALKSDVASAVKAAAARRNRAPVMCAGGLRSSRRRAGVDVHPGLFPRSKHRGNPCVRRALLVLVGGGELDVGDLEHRAPDTIVIFAGERDVGMMRPAGCRPDVRVVDSYERRFEPRELVTLSVEQPSERRELHVFFLKSAVGKD
jgi:hypothetical protein